MYNEITKESKMNQNNKNVNEKAEYLKDFVFAANDGLVTTFSVAAGSQGADIAAIVVVVLGLANLISDGFSMASGNYLGTKSEEDYKSQYEKHFYKDKKIILHSLTTFVAFVSAGFVPLIPYILGLKNTFELAVIFFGLCLIAIGMARSYFSNRQLILSILETFAIGSLAAGLAYLTGHFLRKNFIQGNL